MTQKKRPDQHADPCPLCHGEGVVPGDRYTEPAKQCPTCGGTGLVPAAADE